MSMEGKGHVAYCMVLKFMQRLAGPNALRNGNCLFERIDVQ
jgi:hypothetical protein